MNDILVTIKYGIGSVPVSTASMIFGKDATWVRAGIIAGWLPIGVATRQGIQVTDVNEMDSRLGRINFYISPKKLYEYTGFVWKGKEQEVNAHEHINQIRT